MDHFNKLDPNEGFKSSRIMVKPQNKFGDLECNLLFNFRKFLRREDSPDKTRSRAIHLQDSNLSLYREKENESLCLPSPCSTPPYPALRRPPLASVATFPLSPPLPLPPLLPRPSISTVSSSAMLPAPFSPASFQRRGGPPSPPLSSSPPPPPDSPTAKPSSFTTRPTAPSLPVSPTTTHHRRRSVGLLSGHPFRSGSYQFCPQTQNPNPNRNPNPNEARRRKRDCWRR